MTAIQIAILSIVSILLVLVLTLLITTPIYLYKIRKEQKKQTQKLNIIKDKVKR